MPKSKHRKGFRKRQIKNRNELILRNNVLPSKINSNLTNLSKTQFNLSDIIEDESNSDKTNN